MYLVLFDKHLLKGEERYYYVINGRQYELLCQTYSSIENITKDDIEEILVIAGGEEKTCKAIVAECDYIEASENSLKIGYGRVEELSYTCEEINKHLFAYRIKNGLVSDDNKPRYNFIVQDTRDYSYIKGEKKEAKYLSIMGQVEMYQSENNWKAIVELFPKEDEIESSPFWDEISCLIQLSFALSKLEARCDYKREKREKQAYERFFLKVSNRCLYLDSKSTKTLSIRAYFHYNKYKNSKRNDEYEKAYELYEQLIEISNERYKEFYRFTKLRDEEFKNKAWTGQYVGSDWYKRIDTILTDYEQIIEDYDKLDVERQKKYKGIYCKALFGYSKVCINYLFDYWKIYFEYKFYGKPVKSYMLENKQITKISKVEKYLDKIYTIKECQNPTAEKIEEKPSLLEILYRMAQIKQIEGMIYVLNNKEGCERHFQDSISYAKQLFGVAKEFQGKAKFNYPEYAKIPCAISGFFLGEFDECHRNFNRAKPYMKYEEARIFILEGRVEEAKIALREIPANDKCYAKTQKLLKELENE